MTNFLAGCLGWLLLIVGAVAPALAQTPAPAPAATKATLEGEYRGPLPVPGGSLPLSITVTELANGTRFAVLNVPAQRINRAILTLDLKADTLIFDSQELGCSYVCRRSADGQQLQGQWRQQGFQPVTLTLQFTPLPPQPKVAFKFPPPYRVEEVSFTSAHDNTKLAGVLTVPSGEGPFPTVLLLSDLGPQDRDFAQGDYKLFGALADYLTRHGVAVLRLDDRGVGQSGGDWRTATPLDLLKDAQTALNFLRSRPRIDIAQLGIIGVGTGANVGLEAAAQPLGPAYVVSLGGTGAAGAEVLAQRPMLGFLKAGEADTAQENSTRRRFRQQQATAEKITELRGKGANSAQLDTYVGQQQMRLRASDKKQLDGRYKRQRPMMEIVRHTPDDGQAQAILLNMIRQQQPDLPAEAGQALAREMTTPGYRAYAAYVPTTNLAQLRGSLLLLHGADDQHVQPSNLTLLEKALRDNKRAQARRLDGYNHTWQAPMNEWPLINGQPQPVVSPEVELLILEWIRRQVKG